MKQLWIIVGTLEIIFIFLCIEKALTNTLELNGFICGFASGLITVAFWLCCIESDEGE